MRRDGSPVSHICAKNICRLIRERFMYLVDCSKKISFRYDFGTNIASLYMLYQERAIIECRIIDYTL